MASLLDLYTSVVQPFHNVIFDIERGGFRVDKAVRLQLISETRKKLLFLEKEIKREAEGCYESWMALYRTENEERCGDHPEYRGATKRTKCQGCYLVYQSAVRAKQHVSGMLAQQRTQWGSGIRPGGFALRSDACWRRLLFDAPPHGFGLAASGRRKTAKRKLAQVDKDALAELARAHPDVPVLKLKVQFDSLEHDLSTYLKVAVDAAGFAHPCYHLMTSTGRLASGDDGFEPGRVRRSEAGNMQNVPDRLRRMYVPDDAESVLVQLDWRQVEALVTAWLAGEQQMVGVILDGSRDIHTENALVLADAIGASGVTAENADTTAFPNDPAGRSFRQAGKLTHKLHYGMGADKFSRTYGINRNVCQRIIDAYFSRWPRLRAWQDTTAAEAQAERQLSTPFGRVLRFWNFDRRKHKWELLLGGDQRCKSCGLQLAYKFKGDYPKWCSSLNDREEALAFRPQSIVGDMVKVVGRQLYDYTREWRAARGENGEPTRALRLVTTTHDSWTLNCRQSEVEDVIRVARRVMEQKWEQLDGLWCPVDVAMGRSWNKAKGEEGGLAKWNTAGM